MNDKSGLSTTLYDRNGNMISSTNYHTQDRVRYEYDENNRLIKMFYPNDIIVTYTYDENGNIKTVTDKDGIRTYYTYDDNDNEVLRTTGIIETVKRYDADNRLTRIQNRHKVLDELIDEYSYRYDSNNNIIEEIKREPYKKKVETLDMTPLKETDRTIRVTKQTFTYDDENKLTDARVERLGMKALTEPNVTTYHYEYDENGNRTLVEIKDDGLTLESTVYEYDRLNKMIRSREVTASGLYIYEYTYDINGNLISEDRHRQYELNTNQYQNIRRYEYTKDNKLECVYSGNTLLTAYTYDGDGTITSTFDRDLDLNQNLNINDRRYLNSLTNNQRQLINKVNPSDSFLYEFTEYVIDKNRPYSETLMERDGVGNLSTLYTYGNQRINSESYNNLSGLYTYDGRGSVSAVIGTWGDYRATYWYDGLGNVKSQIHGYGAFGSGKKYYGYNAESYNPVTGNQNLRNRQVNIRRQRFLTEDTFIGVKNRTLSLNRYVYAEDNPLKNTDPSGNVIPVVAAIIIGAIVAGGIVGGVAGVATGDVKTGLAVGGVTALSVATGGTVGAAVAGSAAVISTVGTAAAGTIGVMSGAVATSISRNALGDVVLGENNSASKIAKDALTSAAVSGTLSVAGYGISTAYSYLHSNQSTSTITQNAGYVNPDGTGSRLGQEMAGAATNSRSGGCIKAPVDYSDSYRTKLLPSAPYPPNNGAIHGTEHTIKLEPGTKIDRFGDEYGRYFAPIDTPISMRSLRPNTNISEYHQYIVEKTLDVESSIIAPYYGQIGLGTQYRSQMTVEELINSGYIKEVGGP